MGQNSLRQSATPDRGFAARISEIWEKRNTFTNVVLLSGCLLYLVACTLLPDMSGSEKFSVYLIVLLCFYMMMAYRLFLGIGRLMSLPLKLPLFICILAIGCEKYYLYVGFAAAAALVYYLLLSSQKLKKNGVSGIQLLHYSPSDRSIKDIWRERSVTANVLLILISIGTTLLGVISVPLLWDVIIKKNHWADIILALYGITLAIGQIAVLLGRKNGCWLIWYGTLCSIFFAIFDHAIPVIIGAIFPPVLIHLVLLIRKNKRSALSVMK